MENKRLVYSTKKSHMASIVQNSLETEGIKVLVFNHKDSTLTVLGRVELYVEPEQEERAKEIVANFQGEEEEE